MVRRYIVVAAMAAAGLGVQSLTAGQDRGPNAAASAKAVSFEVASIKPAEPLNPGQIMAGRQRIGMKIDAARVDIANLTLEELMRIAYDVKPYQIVAPEWMKGQRWDVVAKLPEGASPAQAPQMLQALLADRFKLAVRRESKEHAVYALVVGKNGPKLQEAEDPAPHADAAAGPGPGNFAVGADAKGTFLSSDKLGTVRMAMVPGAGMRLEADRASMAALADMLSRIVDRPVVDMTGLKGTYKIAVELTIEDMRNMAAAAGVAAPNLAPGGAAEQKMEAAGIAGSGSIFQNVQQLGLKLEARKAPVEMIVVEHAEKTPTEN